MSQFVKIKNISIIISVIFFVVAGVYYLKIDKDLLKETIKNNTFQRRLNYDSAIIDRELRCKELGKYLKLGYDLYYDIASKKCSPEIKTGDLIKDAELPHGYDGLVTKEYLEGYNFLFDELKSEWPIK